MVNTATDRRTNRHRAVANKHSVPRYVDSVDGNSLVVKTPRANHTESRLPITVELNSASRHDTGHFFDYRPDPAFVDIEPRTHLLV